MAVPGGSAVRVLGRGDLRSDVDHASSQTTWSLDATRIWPGMVAQVAFGKEVSCRQCILALARVTGAVRTYP